MKRFEYSGKLKLPYGYQSGGSRELVGPDRPLFRDHEGSIELCGTALAGLLRGDMDRIAQAQGEECRGRAQGTGVPKKAPPTTGCECRVCELMGPRTGRTPRHAGTEGLHASRLHVSGGRAESPPRSRVRDHVGIDRRTGTAADERKYDVEVIDTEVRFPFRLRMDSSERLEESRQLLEMTLHRMESGWLFAGGRKGSGQGLVQLVELSRRSIDLSDRETLIGYLLNEDDSSAAGLVEPLVGSSPSTGWSGPLPSGSSEVEWGQFRLRLELTFPLTVLVNDPAAAVRSAWDHVHVCLGDGTPVLPGSSVRGVLRSRAEQVLRSIGGHACDLHRRGSACHERIEEEIKGISGDSADSISGFDAEYARMCLACRVFGCGRLASSVRVTDFHAIDVGQKQAQDYIAVDRFTGGTAKGAKFDTLGLAGARFEGEIHFDLGADRLKEAGLGLLALTFRDLLLGDIPIGFGTAKGFGEYRATIGSAAWYWLRRPDSLRILKDVPAVPEEGRWERTISTPSEALAGLGPLAARLEDCVRATHEAAAAKGIR